ncbi:MAG: glycosyltransferase, partial [Bosea sp. (in: a-proteobacteria)]
DSHDEALPGHVRIHVLPGCGVDPLIHSADPMPWLPPLKLVFGSPLLWANGPDVAVEAVSRARAAGAEVTLSLIGRACQPGRAAVPEATLLGWSRMAGINWFAPTADVSQIWRQHHMLVLPSRGGDGLPLLVTEAASAGRAILTSDAAGCRSFVRDGIDGLVVPKDDVGGLANAIIQLARAPGLIERMGRSARERVLDGYTERHVMEAYKRIWQQALQREVVV